jgi:hypothetical protein
MTRDELVGWAVPPLAVLLAVAAMATWGYFMWPT